MKIWTIVLSYFAVSHFINQMWKYDYTRGGEFVEKRDESEEDDEEGRLGDVEMGNLRPSGSKERATDRRQQSAIGPELATTSEQQARGP